MRTWSGWKMRVSYFLLAGSRAIAFLLFAGALLGVLFSAYLTYLEAMVIQAWCRYCVASAILITVIFVATLPEVKRIRD